MVSDYPFWYLQTFFYSLWPDGGRTHDLQYTRGDHADQTGGRPTIYSTLEAITLIRPGVDPTIYSTRGDHADQTGGRPHDLQYSRRSR
jgi:hypothetical protein